MAKGKTGTHNQKSMKKLLERHGWRQVRSKGHQVKMRKDGVGSITLPDAKRQDYSRGMTRAILKQAGIGSEEEGNEDNGDNPP